MTRDGSACDYWNPSECEGSPHCPPRCPRFVDRCGLPWVVRPFDSDDRESLVEMYADFDPDQRAQGIPPLRERRIEEWLDALLDEGCNFVATDGQRVAGHALYTPADAAEPELAVFVHQAYQGRGIGTELCSHVVAAAAAADRDAVVLEVEPRNRTAVGVYETVGFRRVDDDAPAEGLRASSLRMRHPLGWGDAFDARQPPALRP